MLYKIIKVVLVAEFLVEFKALPVRKEFKEKSVPLALLVNYK